jgi:hypothetical protein
VNEFTDDTCPAAPVSSAKSDVADSAWAEPQEAWHLALRQLDLVIVRALRITEESSATAPELEPFRGLSISAEDVVRLLAASTAAHLLADAVPDPVSSLVEPLADEPRVNWLRATFDLEDFDVAVLILVMAPELDLRFERLYAFLQDDIAKRQARVDLCLTLLCTSNAQRVASGERLAASGTLLRNRLLVANGETSRESTSGLARTLRIDRQIVDFLLYRDVLDPRLCLCCKLIVPRNDLDDAPLPGVADERLRAHFDRALYLDEPLQVYLHTADAMQAHLVAGGLARARGSRVLEVDLRLVLREPDPAHLLAVIFREAWLRALTLHLRHAEALLPESEGGVRECLFGELATAPATVVLSGNAEWRVLEWGIPRVLILDGREWTASDRRRFWTRCAGDADLAANPTTLARLAHRFRLQPTQIVRAVVAASQTVHGAATTDETSDPQRALFAAARDQSGQRLADLALRIKPRYTWEDIVLPEDSVAQLREICDRISGQALVLDTWGFESRLSQGKGTSVLFAGPSGTGKTMTAEVVANELNLDLYKINLANIVSKYIGETEKNLDRVFAAAHDANAVLLFDEAEALFGKRSEVRDAHDRYANIEIAYLLQRIESFDGLAILSTNLRQNIDESFTRRLAFTVHFPFPDAADRRRIWASIWPRETPLDAEIDFDVLAERFKFSGGNIKNVALAAAFLAAREGAAVGMRHLLHCVRREFQKQGKVLREADTAMPELQAVS